MTYGDFLLVEISANVCHLVSLMDTIWTLGFPEAVGSELAISRWQEEFA